MQRAKAKQERTSALARFFGRVAFWMILGAVLIVFGFIAAIVTQAPLPDPEPIGYGEWQGPIMPGSWEDESLNMRAVRMPTLIPCGENGAYRCMDNHEYIQLVGKITALNFQLENPNRPACKQSGCLCAMDERLKQ